MLVFVTFIVYNFSPLDIRHSHFLISFVHRLLHNLGRGYKSAIFKFLPTHGNFKRVVYLQMILINMFYFYSNMLLYYCLPLNFS